MAIKQTKLDLPEVKDIPGQEHVRPPRLGELADTTPSSADEEGDDVLEPRDGDEDITSATDADVTPEERKVLEDIDYRKAESEDQPLIEGQLDNTDGDGDPLNEDDDDLSGEDLDVPGAEDDDLNEEIGEEDEENNEYSLDDNDEENEL
ncbi:hypothetical protein Q4E93_08000 [Flavitalea sp. BT771]|uniref:hypothetical protein n=1 Tax=Flavitalea sp. BT771 TaxID=3063329 RepID=UPI0026E25E68|nr:hypothetical protein [Flavitalea sp. BT771]MDO6430524.1 hypothetical protein [Flavitalea sp. BT771]MDV6219336.1 hypothetical protein [Flavitalea sp. BT771]